VLHQLINNLVGIRKSLICSLSVTRTYPFSTGTYFSDIELHYPNNVNYSLYYIRAQDESILQIIGGSYGDPTPRAIGKEQVVSFTDLVIEASAVVSF
jgi:hypothetical protein